MNSVDRDGATAIAHGAAFLSCGGGGTLSSSLKMVQDHFPATGKVSLVSVEEAGADESGLTAACTFIGSPTAGKNVTDPAAVSNAVRRFTTLMKERTGRTIRRVIPLELGVQSSVVPSIMVASQTGLDVVDGDGASRPIMGLQYTTFSTGGLSPNPGVLANTGSDTALIETEDPADFTELSFAICAAPSFGVAGLALWAMDGPTLKRVVRSVGTVELSLKIGRAMQGADPVNAVLKLLEPRWTKVLLEGKVSSVLTKVTDFSTITVKTNDGVDATVLTYGSNALVYRSDRVQPVAMSPDSLCWITPAGETLSNTELPHGAHALLIGIAAPRFLREGSMLEGFNTFRRKMGYAGSYVPIEDLQKGT